MARAESTPGRMIVAVLVTCLVSATALTLTYEATSDRIAAQERQRREEALGEALPGATGFEEVSASDLDRAIAVAGDTPVYAVYIADAGWDVVVGPRGYGGPIQMVVGMDRDGKVTGVSIITQSETPGLGTKIVAEPEFLEQFVGWEGSDIDQAASSFDAISGATKSSNGVRSGVVAAAQVYVELSAEGGGSGDE